MYKQTHTHAHMYPYAKDVSNIWHMGWPRLVGSLKSYVAFSEYSLFYRALLQKRPIIYRSY